MILSRILFIIALFAQSALSFAATAIEIEKVERTNAGITIYGASPILPPGTKLWATVIRFNGKKVGDAMVLKDTKVLITPGKKFVANLSRNNQSAAYPPEIGKYQVEFYAIFNRAWQEVPVLKAVGARLDEQGRAIDSEPRSLPSSTDLIKEDIFGEKVRVLSTRRTIDLKHANSVGASESSTKKIVVEIHDVNAANNPVRAFDATNLSVNEAIKKAGRVGKGRAMSVLCNGDFKDGLGQRSLADDLIYPDGRVNPIFKVNDYANMMDVCITQETSYNSRRRR
ncbi:hypothetical protein [Massilia oculi]|uniref:hypothetical protein n=1 Tax=Massilia oculi TaxID=945844 RepID=UPI001AAFD557|nr:hypothetical protein [Massilia oculi]